MTLYLAVLSVLFTPLLARCSDAAPTPGVSSAQTAVKAPIGRFFLVRSGARHAAIMLLPEPPPTREGRQYLWYYQNDGSGVFTNATATKGRGVVAEHYRTVSDPEDPSRSVMVLAGDPPELVCGGLRVAWSEGDWVYFNDCQGLFTNIQIALTDVDDIRGLNYMAADLKWCGPSK